MPDSDARWTGGGRAGCGCSLAGFGAGATFFGVVWWAFDDFYGDGGILAEAVLFAGLGAVVLGVVLLGLSFREPE